MAGPLLPYFFDMKTFLLTGLFLLLALVFSMPISAQSASKDQLVEKFRTNSKSDHKTAYEAAKEFFQRYPDDTSEDAQFMKRWMAAYEKVEMNGQPSPSFGNQPTSKSGNSSPPSETETPEVAEARIAITKYKDYQGAIKSLESSASETKRMPLWLFYMAIAQEGVGNEAEELRYLEKYNELVPNQKETVDKLADLRYRVKKKLTAENEKAEKERKELDEENRYGTLEQTQAWLSANAHSVFVRYVDFVGQKMISSNCSKENPKGYCWTRSVSLSAVDISTLNSIPKIGNEAPYIVVKCKVEGCVSVHRTDKINKSYPEFSSGDGYTFAYSYDDISPEKAQAVMIALRHAIRLSQP
jgi:hypothetical protein